MKKITLILAFIFHSVMSYSQIGTYTFNNIYYVEADTAFVGTEFKVKTNLCFSEDRFDIVYNKDGNSIKSILSDVPLISTGWTEETSFDDYVVYSQKAHNRSIYYIWFNKTTNTVFKMIALDLLDAAMFLAIDENK